MTSSGDVIVKTKEDIMHYSITRNKNNEFVTVVENEEMRFSDFESLYEYIVRNDEMATFLRDDYVSDHHETLNAIYDFDSMNRAELRIIHARAHSRRNAFRECAYCVRDFIENRTEIDENEKSTFARPINSRMSHDSCGHERSKSARAKCRRERRNALINDA